MTMPGGGGDRLEVQVVADASGFAADARAKIDAAAANVKAKIAAEIDERRLRTQIEAAAKAASAGADAKVQLSLDSNHFAESVRAAVAEVNARHYAVKVGIEVDRSQLVEAAAAAQGAGSTITHRVETVGGGEQQVTVTADTTRAAAEMDALRAREKAKPIDVPIELQQDGSGGGGSRGRSVAGRGVIGGGAGLIGNLTKNLSGMEKFGAITGIIQGLGGAVDALGGGLISMAGAASQAVGVLAALPNLAGVAAQGIGSLVLGFSGITKAVGLMTQTQTAAGQSAQANASARIRAQEAVANAEQNVANVARTTTEQIASAEHGVETAQRSSLQAQQALTQARKDAEQALKDYKNQLADAALSEESAGLAIEKARENWNKTMRSPVSTALDRKEADLALRQAEQNLVDIKASNAQLQQQADQANQKGVEGAANVVAAKNGVADATWSQSQAEQQLRDTQITTAQQTAAAQRGLADAVRSLNDLLHSQAAAGNALAAALAKLSPAGREFVRFIHDELMPKFTDLKQSVQEALLPPVERGVKAALPLLDTLKAKMVDSAGIMGTFVENVGHTMGTPLFRGQVASIMDSNNRALGKFTDAAEHMLSVLMRVGVAVEPIVERFATWIDKLATRADDASSNTDRLAGFFQRASDRAAQLGDIIGNLAGALFGLGKGGTSAGGDLLDSLDKVTQKWSDWANSTEGQAKIKDYMDKLVPVVKTLGDVLKDVVKIFVAMGDHQGTLKVILDIFDGIAKFLSMPLVAPFVSGLMALAGVATILSIFITRLTKIKDLFDALGKVKTSVGKAAGKVGDAVDRVQDNAAARRSPHGGVTTQERQAADDKVRQRNQARPRVAPRQESPQQRLDRVRDQATDRVTPPSRRRRAAGAVAGTVGALGTVMSGYGGENADDVTTPASRAAERTTSRSGSTASGQRQSARARVAGRVRGAAGGAARKAGGAVSTVRGVTSGRAPATAVDSAGQEVGGLGGQIGGFAEKVQAATAKASQYVGGWAGDALKKVSTFSGSAGKLVADWSSQGVGKAMSTAGGYIQQFASGNGEQIKNFAKNAGSRVGEFAKDAGGKVTGWAKSAGGAVAEAAGSVAGSVGRMVGDAGRTAASWASTAAQTVGHWARMGAAATVNAVKAGATWLTESATKGAQVAASWVVTAASTIAQWVAMAAAATLNAVKSGATWVAETLASTGKVLIQWGITVAAVIAGWVTMAVESLANAARMAASWLIAMGPIGLIIAIVIGLVALIIANWDTIKKHTVEIFQGIGDFISGIWSGLGNGLKTAVNWIIDQLNGLIHGANKLIDGINVINPFGSIGHIPDIPHFADGTITTQATLAVIGEAGPELVLPLSPNKKARRDELLRQAGLAPSGASSLTSLVAGGASSRQATAGGQHVGTVIAEGAIQQTIINPKPETPGQTLNARMRRLADLGIFGQTPAGA